MIFVVDWLLFGIWIVVVMFWLFVFALVGVDCFCCAVFVLSFILYVVVSLIIF